jgi:hypothetical protein
VKAVAAAAALRDMKMLKPILLLGCLIPCAVIAQNDTELVSKSISIARRFVVSNPEFHRILQLAEDGTYSWTEDDNAAVLVGKWKEIGPNAEDGPGTTRISLDNVPLLGRFWLIPRLRTNQSLQSSCELFWARP